MRKVRMVKGPATVMVHGTCHVLGSNVSDQTISVRAGKALPFELTGRSKIYVTFGHGAKIWTADPSTAGSALWHSIPKKIFAMANGQRTATVMLVGDTDTGKSTLSTYLANIALAYGMVPCVIDGDIGQSDLAPPSAIGAAILSKQVVDLRNVQTSIFEFVGSLSPAGIEHFVIAKLESILKKINQLGNITIINTDGYVRDGGMKYKIHMAEMLQPDVIVCLGKNLPLFHLLKSGSWQILRAPSSDQIYKSKIERRERRFDQFLRHIGNGKKKVDRGLISYVYMDNIFRPLEAQQSPIKQLEPANMQNMFIGLGFENILIGFGKIDDVSRDNLYIQTDVQDFNRVYLSNIHIGIERGAEIKP